MAPGIVWDFTLINRQVLPILAGLATLLGAACAEPDPGRVDAFGRRVNRDGKSIQYIRADPQASSPELMLPPHLPPTQLRALEVMRTIRKMRPEGTLIFRNGHRMALLGCRHDPDLPETLQSKRKVLEKALEGKVVRLVMDEEVRNASGELAAYVFLQDGTLLNETLLREGLCNLDTRTPLSSQYSLRFKKAAETGLKARSKAVRHTDSGTRIKTRKNAAANAQPPELPEYSRGFVGLSSGSTTALRTKRAREDKPSGGSVFPGHSNQSPRSREP